MMNSIEQRRSVRFRFLGHSFLECEVMVAGRHFPGVIMNASASGLGLEVRGEGQESLSRHASVRVGLEWQGEALQLSGELVHVGEWRHFGVRRLGVQLTAIDAAFQRELQAFCQDMAQRGRASGMSLNAVAESEELVLRVHGALSLKTVADAVNVLSTRSVRCLDLSDSHRDGELGGRLGKVALAYGVKIQGCPPDLAGNMRQAGVCSACTSCGHA